MAELTRNCVGCPIRSQCPDVDRASCTRVLLRKPFFRHTHPDAGWMSVQMTPHQIHIPECRRHKKIGFASARHEVASDILAVAWVVTLLLHAQHILGRRRFVIHIDGVNLRAALEKESGNLDRRSKVQRRLSISASAIYNAWVRRD